MRDRLRPEPFSPPGSGPRHPIRCLGMSGRTVDAASGAAHASSMTAREVLIFVSGCVIGAGLLILLFFVVFYDASIMAE